MDAKARFHQAVEEVVYPMLRQEGFRGSGPTLRLFREDIVQVFSFQNRREGGSSCVNLGTHPLFLPSPSGRISEPWDRVEEHSCEFRRRLAPEGQVDRWWSHEGTGEEITHRAKEILDLYLSVGRRFYARAVDLRGLLSSITPADVSKGDLSWYPGNSTAVRAALTLARLCVHFGRPDSAAVFARVGLEKCRLAVSLRPEFRRIINGEPSAPPNGGPATPLGNSGVTEGPPSVS